MTKPALTRDQELRLVAEYNGEDDWTINELSVMFKVSHRTVYRVLSKHGARRVAITRKGRNARGEFTPKPKSRAKPKPKRELKPCGTDAAYRRHKYNGEYPCSACLAAHAADTKKRKEKK